MMPSFDGAGEQHLDHARTGRAKASAVLLFAVDHHYDPFGLEVVLAADGAAGVLMGFGHYPSRDGAGDRVRLPSPA
jgi:hypothetical protein